MPGIRIHASLFLAATLLAGCTAPTTADHRAAWQSLPLQGISGLAPAGSRWIAVSDAKKKGEPRALLIAKTPAGVAETRSLTWVGTEPVDIEAISSVPGVANRFVAVTSRGEWSAMKLTDGSLRVTATGPLPDQGDIDELEGFSLARIGNRPVAVWGNRGSDKKPGRIFWCEWSGRRNTPFGRVQSAEIRLPWPRKDVRHISDLRLDSSGRLLVSSASDPGDKGPFASAVWEVGRFEITEKGITWNPHSKPVQLLREGPNGHKVEAISVDPAGNLVVASDDEALGSAIRF